MYLHRLELRAIGPYPDLVTIDFAALAASGVFLLEGPTGSGKSTIIDAVVFALYGGLAGADASTDRLHSQHADPSVEPYVELVFETGAGVYRVRRTPQYDRPKQRGSGTVKQQASVHLVRLASPSDTIGEPVSARIPEVALEIGRIIGLDRAQFLQTVVLPQGEFARFLRSPGEDRRKLLQSLFGTEVYDRTADELAARRRAVLAEVEGADARVRDAMARFAQAAGVDDVDEGGVTAVVAGLEATADVAETARRTAVDASAAAEAHQRALTARAAALDRRTTLLRRRAELDAAAPTVDAARVRLAVDERAARVAVAARGLDTARERAAVTAAAAEGLRAQHGVTASGAALVQQRSAIEHDLAAVHHLVAVEADLPARRQATEASVATAERLAATLVELDAALDARPAERFRIVEAARSAAETATGAEAARHEVEHAERLRADLTARATSEQRVTDAESAVATTRQRAEASLAAEQQLRERRIAGLAGELGAALVPGDPCPVCGATEHPAVATPQDGHPTTDDIEAAAAEARRSERALADAATVLAVERAELTRLGTVLGDTDAASVQALADAAASRVRAAHDASVQVLDLERRRHAHDEGTRELQRQRNTVDMDRSVLLAAAASDSERIDLDVRTIRAATDRLSVHLEDRPATLGLAVERLDVLLGTWRAVSDADDSAAVAQRGLSERAQEVERVLADQGFTDVATAREGVLDPRDAERLRAEVTAADRERAVVDDGLTEPAVVAAAGDAADLLDVEGGRLAAEAAVRAADDATRVAVTASDRAKAARTCASEVDRALRARDDISARSRAVVRLADIANGATAVNPAGITLGTYVLMRRFEDVVAAANDRLRGMLAGRFALQTSDERESGSRARRTGLALAIRDHTTDTVRDPRSLSGGETFTVSLCLALGLADVVQAEAGGVSLGTLFVDEGFGTLDPEALDEVIGQLSRLTAGGRQVGIVSHVEELKTRIPERIAVRRTASGASRLTTTV
ncbi:AAA family ATPase [Curtobacterium sp. ISL-83]|uniref:AAA family ATPase n=1 Tax=Curtobacterium sp. ISL-83 TaxID=2819145 RepID=UPI001BEBB097|nr:SMC family ATPase [Curtobacterium sp. ISL-83]MBT2502791.1 SMC family ATPase [Curtobacterium sp. ISL-83]